MTVGIPAGIPAGTRNGYLGALVAAIPGTPGRQLRIDLIPQTVALREAFQAQFGKPLDVTDAYRTFVRQVQAKAEKGPYAATPGTSNHGWGQAIDFGSGVNLSFSSPEHLWMRANAGRYGWSHPAWAHNHNPNDGMDEPWHFEAVFVPASSYRTSTPTPALPAIPPPALVQEDDMPTIVTAGTAGAYLLDGGKLLPLDQNGLAEATRNGYKTMNIGRDLYLMWVRANPAGVLLRNNETGAVVVSVGGAPFVAVGGPDYEALYGQGVPIRNLSGGLFDAVVAASRSTAAS